MAAKKTSTTEVTPVTSVVVSEETPAQTTALSAPVASQTALAAPSVMDEFAGDEEKMTAADLLLPRYRVVQKMTKKAKARGLEEGMFYNTLTGEGLKRALVIALLEEHLIVERVNDDTGKFIGTLPLEPEVDPRVKKAFKANGNSYVKMLSVDKDPATKLIETYNIHVAFLDEKDGVTPIGFGVLSCDSTNLMPRKVWKNDRNSVNHPTTGKKFPGYFLRTIVTCAVKDNSAKQKEDSSIFKFTPYKDNWLVGRLDENKPEELALLRRAMEHKKLVEAGVFTVEQSDPGEGEESETDQENRSFDPDDDGRAPATAKAAGARGSAADPEDF